MQHKRKRRPREQLVTHYTMLDELMSSPTEPMPEVARRHQLTRMYGGLHALETAASPAQDDWSVCADAVNLMETLVLDMKICQDESGLLSDAIESLSTTWRRSKKGAAMQLDGLGIQAVRAVLQDYASLLDVLPHRVMVRCHILTERRIFKIRRGLQMPHDIQVVPA